MKKHVIPLIALILAASSFGASATIPDADGVIHGCFSRSDGRLRVINTDRGRSCGPREKPLNWNEEGRRGRRGPQGLQGEAGPQGLQGDPGDQSPFVTTVVASTTVAASPTSYDASWTLPDETIGHLYWRATITTPGGSCASQVEPGAVKLFFRLNGSETSSPALAQVGLNPGGTVTHPPVDSDRWPHALLPGDYDLTTEITPTSIPPECLGGVVETEVFVETVTGAA